MLWGETTNLGSGCIGSAAGAGRIELIEDSPTDRSRALASAECRT